MPQLLLQNIKNHVTLSTKEEEQIIAVLKYKKLRKKHFVLQEGEVQSQLVFVKEGCLRSYSIDDNGFEHILQFAPPGWWIADMESLIKNQPASLNIDAVDDSQIIFMSTIDLEKLYQSIPQLERSFRLLAERSLATYQHRLIDALSLPAKQRYMNFCARYPTLITCLPQKYVASYIGITPEFLSKMLKEKM